MKSISITEGLIPSNIEILKFGTNFNRPIPPNLLPSSIKSLTFGDRFDQTLSEHSIPKSVQSLVYYGLLGHFRKNSIPPPPSQPLPLPPPLPPPQGISSLKYSYDFNESILSTEMGPPQPPLPPQPPPSNIHLYHLIQFHQALQIYHLVTILINNSIPPNVRSLKTNNSITTIKSNNIRIWFSFNQPITPDSIPSNVTSLTFGYGFNQPISELSLPPNIKSLNLGGFKHPITIPSTIKSLTLNSPCFQLNNHSIPSTIKIGF
ncbi:hypothetical protein ACTA71_008053 [Dictyostelium dimigraforme]